MANLDKKFDFVTVGLSVYKHEFYLNFAYPSGLQMKVFAEGKQAFRGISLRDWLESCLPHLLCISLHVNNPTSVRVFHVAPFRLDWRNPSPVSMADSRPSSWSQPFISLIASTFINLYANEV